MGVGEDKAVRKHFFFCRKRSKKTFIHLLHGKHLGKGKEVFWFFFSKKNILPSYAAAATPRRISRSRNTAATATKHDSPAAKNAGR
jgi:hypothetical protein